ncbi:PilZ domain-containing protein [Massilia rhizosphaerae]|uniref:PilZ domain-containing protein n=1 Tax=Massilia rhizosphaerae TaxID=2784389 RepID=UPI0018DC6E7F
MVTDQRNSARKILKVRAILAMEGQPPVQGRTSDVGTSGVSVTVPHPLHTGQTGQVGFDLLVDGNPFPLHARVKVMYCIFSNGEFKAGFQFLNLDLSSMSQLSRFLR